MGARPAEPSGKSRTLVELVPGQHRISCSGPQGGDSGDGCQVSDPRPGPSPSVPPLPILNPGPPLEEGQGRTLAASCTAEGNPVPTVTWQTEVHGTNITRQSVHPRSASITSEFFLVPGRSMNGKALTCIVAHPGLQHEKRITHMLSIACMCLPRTGSKDPQGLQGWDRDLKGVP